MHAKDWLHTKLDPQPHFSLKQDIFCCRFIGEIFQILRRKFGEEMHWIAVHRALQPQVCRLQDCVHWNPANKCGFRRIAVSRAVSLTKQSYCSNTCGQAQNSNCLGKTFHSAYHACLTKKSAIQVPKTSWTSSKFQLPQARIFHHETKQSAIQLSKTSWITSKNCLEQKFPSREKTVSANHAFPTKRSNWSKTCGQAQNSNCRGQKISQCIL